MEYLSPETLYEMIEARRLDLGLTQSEVTRRAFGKESTAAIQNLRRGSMMSADKLQAIATALNWQFHFGPPKQAEGFNAPPLDELSVNVEGLRGEQPIQVPASAAAILGWHPSSLKWTRYDHADMVPTIGQMSVIVIDENASPTANQLAAVEINGDLRCGRLTRIGDATIMTSDTIGAPPKILPSDATDWRYLGRVIWTARLV